MTLIGCTEQTNEKNGSHPLLLSADMIFGSQLQPHLRSLRAGCQRPGCARSRRSTSRRWATMCRRRAGPSSGAAPTSGSSSGSRGSLTGSRCRPRCSRLVRCSCLSTCLLSACTCPHVGETFLVHPTASSQPDQNRMPPAPSWITFERSE